MTYDATPIRTLHRIHTDGVINTYAMEITVNIDVYEQSIKTIKKKYALYNVKGLSRSADSVIAEIPRKLVSWHYYLYYLAFISSNNIYTIL